MNIDLLNPNWSILYSDLYHNSDNRECLYSWEHIVRNFRVEWEEYETSKKEKNGQIRMLS